MNRRLTLREWIALAAAIVFFAVMVGNYLVNASARRSDIQDRIVAEARSTVSNCQQIELVKGEIRSTVQASLDRLPSLEYYKTHPAELALAIGDATDSIRLFHPVNCYTLPAAVAVGLKPPKKRG